MVSMSCAGKEQRLLSIIPRKVINDAILLLLLLLLLLLVLVVLVLGIMHCCCSEIWYAAVIDTRQVLFQGRGPTAQLLLLLLQDTHVFILLPTIGITQPRVHPTPPLTLLTPTAVSSSSSSSSGGGLAGMRMHMLAHACCSPPFSSPALFPHSPGLKCIPSFRHGLQPLLLPAAVATAGDAAAAAATVAAVALHTTCTCWDFCRCCCCCCVWIVCRAIPYSNTPSGSSWHISTTNSSSTTSSRLLCWHGRHPRERKGRRWWGCGADSIGRLWLPHGCCM
jgi:hypothetical protein